VDSAGEAAHHGPVELTDGVVRLRPPTLDDADPVVALVQASLAHLAPWMPWATADYDLGAFHEWVTTSAHRGDRPLLVLDGGGQLLGATGLNQMDPINRRANLGYWLGAGWTGRGFATRAVVLVARWAVERLGLARIDIVMAVGNHPSRAVADRVGAYHEGVQRSALALPGGRHDAHLYSLLAHEVRAWPPGHPGP
jgi:RimJ/RimL family protein N-acetyltransferase